MTRECTLSRRAWLGTVAALTTLVTIGLVPAGHAAEGDPQALVRETTERLLSAIAEARAQIEENPGVAHELVDEIVTPHVDLERAARWILGPHWRQASERQRGRFVEEFRRMLLRTYATALTDHTDQRVHYLATRPGRSDSDALVRTAIPRGDGPPVAVDYRMHRNDGSGWLVYDVIIEGVSMVTTYRTTFGQEVRQGGLDALIERIAAKNQRREEAAASGS